MIGQTHEKGESNSETYFFKTYDDEANPLYIIKKPNFKNKSFPIPYCNRVRHSYK